MANERQLSEHQTPPGARIGSSGEISELPQALSAEDPAEKFTPEYPLPQALSAEDPAEKFTPEYPLPQAQSAEDSAEKFTPEDPAEKFTPEHPARKPFSADPTDGEDIHNTVGFGVRRQVPDARLSRRRRSAR